MVMILLPWQRTKGVSWVNNWHISLHLSISLVTGKPNPKNRQKFYTDGGSYYQIIAKKKAICWKGESYTQINKLVIYDRFYTGWGIPHSENQNMTFPIPTFTICYDFVLWIALFFPIWNNFPGSYSRFGKRVQVTRRNPTTGTWTPYEHVSLFLIFMNPLKCSIGIGYSNHI